MNCVQQAGGWTRTSSLPDPIGYSCRRDCVLPNPFPLSLASSPIEHHLNLISSAHWCSSVSVSGVLWLSCEAPAARSVGPPGFHTTAREPKCAQLSAPALQTPPKFHEKTPRERTKNEISVEESKKSAKFWATHPSGPHPSLPSLLRAGHGRLWPNRLWPNRLWPIF